MCVKSFWIVSGVGLTIYSMRGAASVRGGGERADPPVKASPYISMKGIRIQWEPLLVYFFVVVLYQCFY